MRNHPCISLHGYTYSLPGEQGLHVKEDIPNLSSPSRGINPRFFRLWSGSSSTKLPLKDEIKITFKQQEEVKNCQKVEQMQARQLQLPTFTERKVRGDMIVMYMCLEGIEKIDGDD